MKVDGKQVERLKSHSYGQWDESLIGKNVSVMSGNDHKQNFHKVFEATVNFIPDVKIKSLKFTNLLKNPVINK